MTKKDQLKELDRQLWDMTRKLTAYMIPFHPPAKNLTLLQENNPKGYALLTKYLETLKEYEDLKNSTTVEE